MTAPKTRSATAPECCTTGSGDAATDEDRAILRLVDGQRLGAVVMGRSSFEKNEGDGGWGDAGPAGDVPCFVLTHHPPTRRHSSVFTFVPDGVAVAIEQAQRVAGNKLVYLSARPSCSRHSGSVWSTRST